jgi:zinc transport system substrate-binding protein
MSSSETIVVAAATAPVAWLGCQCVGQPCRPLALIPPGASAHSWEPRPSDLQALQGATLYLRTGLAFEEGWTPRLASTFPELSILDLRGGLSLLEPSEKGHREEADPHVWASPRAFSEMAETLAVRWVASRPDDSTRLRRSLPGLRALLSGLDTLARARLAPFTGRTFLVNHPGLGYLARDYGLVELPLESHGQELTPVTLFEVRKIARAHGIKAVFVQPEAARRSAEQVAADLGVPVKEVDLLAPGPFDSLFRATLETLAGSL